MKTNFFKNKAMYFRKIWMLSFALGLGISLQAQSQKGKHTLFFYPVHLTYYFDVYDNTGISFLPAVAYNYHFKDDWAVQGKLFYRHLYNPVFGSPRSFSAEKNAKLGLLYYCINKDWQVSLRTSVFMEDRKVDHLKRNVDIYELEKLRDQEIGVEFGLGFGLRLNAQARLSLGIAFRYGKYSPLNSFPMIREKIWLANPLESFGFGYTF